MKLCSSFREFSGFAARRMSGEAVVFREVGRDRAVRAARERGLAPQRVWTDALLGVELPQEPPPPVGVIAISQSSYAPMTESKFHRCESG